jgi:O-antigen/teichoic acid export membrane protein
MPNPAATAHPLSLARFQGFISRTYKSKFVRNVAVVASGTAGAQAITMAFSPIITRLYGPEAFGLLGTFMAIVAVVTPLAALSYPIAIVLPKEDIDARGIAKLSAYIAVCIAALVLLLF